MPCLILQVFEVTLAGRRAEPYARAGPNGVPVLLQGAEPTSPSSTRPSWLHSGTSAHSTLKVSYRSPVAEDIIITAGGKNIAPKNLEPLIKTSASGGESVSIVDRRIVHHAACSPTVRRDKPPHSRVVPHRRVASHIRRERNCEEPDPSPIRRRNHCPLARFDSRREEFHESSCGRSGPRLGGSHELPR